MRRLQTRFVADMSKYTENFFLGMTVRQTVCGIGVILIVVIGSLVLGIPSALCIILAFPVIIAGYFKPDGMPLEKWLVAWVESKLQNSYTRAYEPENAVYDYLWHGMVNGRKCFDPKAYLEDKEDSSRKLSREDRKAQREARAEESRKAREAAKAERKRVAAMSRDERKAYETKLKLERQAEAEQRRIKAAAEKQRQKDEAKAAREEAARKREAVKAARAAEKAEKRAAKKPARNDHGSETAVFNKRKAGDVPEKKKSGGWFGIGRHDKPQEKGPAAGIEEIGALSAESQAATHDETQAKMDKLHGAAVSTPVQEPVPAAVQEPAQTSAQAEVISTDILSDANNMFGAGFTETILDAEEPPAHLNETDEEAAVPEQPAPAAAEEDAPVYDPRDELVALTSAAGFTELPEEPASFAIPDVPSEPAAYGAPAAEDEPDEEPVPEYEPDEAAARYMQAEELTSSYDDESSPDTERTVSPEFAPYALEGTPDAGDDEPAEIEAQSVSEEITDSDDDDDDEFIDRVLERSEPRHDAREWTPNGRRAQRMQDWTADERRQARMRDWTPERGNVVNLDAARERIEGGRQEGRRAAQ